MCGNYTVVEEPLLWEKKMGKESYGEALAMSVLLKKEKGNLI